MFWLCRHQSRIFERSIVEVSSALLKNMLTPVKHLQIRREMERKTCLFYCYFNTFSQTDGLRLLQYKRLHSLCQPRLNPSSFIASGGISHLIGRMNQRARIRSGSASICVRVKCGAEQQCVVCGEFLLFGFLSGRFLHLQVSARWLSCRESIFLR